MDVLPFFINNLGPAIVRQLYNDDGSVFDIQAGQNFRLRMRELYGKTVLLDKAMTVDVANNTLTYQPVVGDVPFTTEGIYRAWIVYSNVSQDADEFQIVVMQHAPGEGKEVGAVWRAARALEPVAWDALRGYPDYGDPELQRVIELAKLRTLHTTVAVDAEVGLDARVVDYLAKKVLANNVLYAAISFWTNQVVAQTARGNSDEVKTYPDRIRAAEEAIKRYKADLEEQQAEVDTILGTPTAIYNAPVVDDQGPTLTPGLDEYGAQPVVTPWRRTTTR